MKKFLFALVVSLVIVSCKDREMQVNEFIANYNLTAKNLRDSQIRNTKALYKDKNEITIEFEFSFLNDSMQMQIIERSIANLAVPIINTIPHGKKLLKDGVNFNLQLFNRNHVKFGQASLNTNSTDISAKVNDLQSLVATLNKSLPVTDPETGYKLLQIELEAKNVVYKYEIPDDLLDIMDLPEMDEIVKEDLRSNPGAQSIFNNRADINVNSIICIYVDKNNVERKKVTLSKQEFLRKISTTRKNQGELELMVILSSLNKNMPVVDDKFGFKFMDIKAASNNSIECNYQVPDKYLDILKMEAFDKSLKLGLLSSEMVYNLINNKDYQINNVINIYKDKNDKELKRFSLKKEDFNKLYVKK